MEASSKSNPLKTMKMENSSNKEEKNKQIATAFRNRYEIKVWTYNSSNNRFERKNTRTHTHIQSRSVAVAFFNDLGGFEHLWQMRARTKYKWLIYRASSYLIILCESCELITQSPYQFFTVNFISMFFTSDHLEWCKGIAIVFGQLLLIITILNYNQ